MLKVFVDSGSSIKQFEKEEYNVEIIPLKILLGDKEYFDGVDLTNDVFYDYLKNSKEFPKTSLPQLDVLEEQVTNLTTEGHDVIIITISSEISGTYNAIRLLFGDNEKVHLIDSRCAVGGMRLIVDEINKNRDLEVKEILAKVNDLIPRIRIAAIPETLEYLHKGGRLSTKEYVLGTAIHLKPLIGFENGKVKMVGKAIGLRRAMKALNDLVDKDGVDTDYQIVASMTNSKENLENLIRGLNPKYKELIKNYDDLDHAIAAHWGPNAFGYIYVKAK
jgi:DegV family protein with EDD domain